ncbi:VOC family protein [Saccharopolyspora sp. CA-218241]|uniref:VOC family protein n=1 Tax=Saccharopolyspora sp. CA-218241 TaxID=3240027 RepID=UPI003D96B5E3
MRINIASIMVDDQAKAHRFYTETLGFRTKHDVAIGGAKWLTVVSPEEPDGTELLLESTDNPAIPAAEYQRAMFDAEVPAISFAVDDVRAEHERLAALGVRFVEAPQDSGSLISAVFDDTCGNLIMIIGR